MCIHANAPRLRPRRLSMRLLVPRETRPGERRVAVVPSVVGKFTQLGFEVVIESSSEIAGVSRIILGVRCTLAYRDGHKWSTLP